MFLPRFLASGAGLLLTLSLSLANAASPRTVLMQVDGLVCAFCAQGIEKKLRALPQAAEVYVDLERHLVALALKPEQDLPDAQLRDALTEAGYSVRDIRRSEQPLAELRAKAAP